MKNFDFIEPKQFTLLATLLGILLLLDLDVNEQNSIGNFIVSIGQSILTNSAQVENLKAHKIDDDIYKKIDSLNAQLNDLKKELKKKE